MITMDSKYPLKPDEFIKHGILAPNNFAPESRVSHRVIYTNINLVMYSRLWNKRSPWNNRSPPLKNFHIMILILFYTNLGIAIIFEFFLSSKFFKN